MKISKRICAVATAVFLMFNPFFSGAYADSSQVINDETKSEVLADGVKHTSIARFTTSGWLDINVVEVDLSNKNTDIDVLYGSEGLAKTSVVSAMAKESGAIAAINGDFFDTKTGSPIGQIVSNGTLISAPPDKGLYGKLSSFNINDNGNAFFDYWTYDFSITLPNGQTLPIVTYNKASNSQYLCLYDHNWGNTPGSSGNSNHTEVIVAEDGTIIDVRKDMPSTAIAQGCYAVVANGDNAATLAMMIPGDKVGINLTTNPGYGDLKLSISGGTMLVKDGAIAPITHDPSPKPTARTAIGVSQDNNKLLLVTVDGRNGKSIGLTEKDMAQLMLDMGAYDALNFDGGGSTTMAIRSLGEKSAVTVNSPSDVSERKVANAVGILNNAPEGAIKGLKINNPDNVFVGSYEDFNVTAYDEGYSPLDVDMSSVQFNVEGVKGTFNGNRFAPASPGNAVITVSYGGLSEQFNVKVLDKPIMLKSDISKINASYNTKAKITIFGKDERGYTAQIPSDKLQWSVHGDIGNVDGGTFVSGASDSSGYVTAAFGDAYLNIPVTIGKPSQQISVPDNVPLENVDPYNKKTDVKNDSGSYNVFVYGNMDKDDLLKNLAINKAIEKANGTSSLAIFTGKGSNELDDLKIPYLAIDSTGLYEFRNSSFIVLDSSKGGLRATDSQQWFKLKDYLNRAAGTNVFIVLPTPVWGTDGFTDQREAELFESTLKDFKKDSGKNVWILYQGKQSFYTAVNDEIRYVGLSGTTGVTKNDIANMPYALIEVNGSNVYYQKDLLFK